MMTLSALQRNISPIPIMQRPGFLTKGLKQDTKHVSNDGERLSDEHSFLMTSAQ